MPKLFAWASVGGKPEKSTHVRNRCTMPHLLTEWERLELEIVALKKKIAEKEKWLKECEEETRKIEMESMNKYGVKPVTGQKRQRDEVQMVEASSSEEQRCCGCRSCQGPWASDGEEADEENDDDGGGITAGSSKNK